MRRFASVCGAVLLFASASALAQNDSPNFQAINTAKALFEKGQKDLADGNFDSACASFKASNDAVARVGTLLNLGDCYEKGGKLASAWGAYFDAIALGRRQGKPGVRRLRAEEKEDELEPKLSKMSIIVPPETKVDGMKVMRDGVLVEPAAYGGPSAVDSGKHSIDVTAPHKIAFHTEATVDDAHKLVEVKIEKLADAPVAWPSSNQPQVVERVVEVPSAWTGLRIGGVVAGSAGVVAVVLGSVLGLVANDKYQSALKNECGGNASACSALGASDGSAAHDLAAVATGLFIGGLVALAGGVTLFVVGAPHATEDRATTSKLAFAVHGDGRGDLGNVLMRRSWGVWVGALVSCAAVVACADLLGFRELEQADAEVPDGGSNDVNAPDVDTCAHTRWPGESDASAPVADASTYIVALKDIFFSTSADGGTPTFGYDLDDHCTTSNNPASASCTAQNVIQDGVGRRRQHLDSNHEYAHHEIFFREQHADGHRDQPEHRERKLLARLARLRIRRRTESIAHDRAKHRRARRDRARRYAAREVRRHRRMDRRPRRFGRVDEQHAEGFISRRRRERRARVDVQQFARHASRADSARRRERRAHRDARFADHDRHARQAKRRSTTT